MKTKQNNKLAFSLIELSVVILVIGILVIGITKGSRIISEAKIKSAMALTQASPAASMEGLVLWLDSVDKDTIASGTVSGNSYGNTADGDSVVIWKDRNPQSVNKIELLAAADNNRPTYEKDGINKLPSIAFDGGVQFLESSSEAPLSAGDNTFTYIIVWAAGLSGQTDVQVLFDQGFSSADSYSGHAGFALYETVFGFGGYNNDFMPSELARSLLKAGQNHITTIVINPTASGVASDSVASIFYDSTTASIGNSATGLQNLDIGEIFTVGTSANDTGGLYNFNGMISELLVFNRPLKSVEIATIQSYLSQKYNIKLS